MARHPERPVGEPAPARRPRLCRWVVRFGRRALKRPLLAAVLALPTTLLALLVVVCSMLLFVRNLGATAQACTAAEAKAPVTPAEYPTGPDAPGPGSPPQNFIPAYFAAANQADAQLGPLGPYVLMGIHEVESGFGRSDAAGVKNGINFANCCKGPFQFYDTSEWSTWKAKSPVSGQTYARDGDRDGDVSIYSNHDAMFAAGALLHASGAPGDWNAAIFAYNHSTAYRDQVLARARYFQQHVQPPAGAAAPPAAAPNAGQGSATQIAAAAGCDVDPEQVIAPAEGGPYSPPLAKRSYTITTKFWTWRGNYNHEGTDLAAPTGTPIHAIGDGKVAVAGEVSGYGNYTCIDHTQRMDSCYGHQSRIDVKVGETVHSGQVIGAVGSTGDSSGPHLHFEIHIDKAPQCPANYVGIDPAAWCESNSPGFGAKPG